MSPHPTSLFKQLNKVVSFTFVFRILPIDVQAYSSGSDVEDFGQIQSLQLAHRLIPGSAATTPQTRRNDASQLK